MLYISTFLISHITRFRWVACQFDTLKHCLSRKDVLRELASLPRTLDETYARIFDRIYPQYKPNAIRLLQLLTYSERPLRLEEAVDAIAIEPTAKPSFDPRNRLQLPTEITRYCSSFVSLARRYDGTRKTQVTEIQLAHFSVQEYLLSNRLDPTISKQLDKNAAAIAVVDLCLSYLLELDTSLKLDQIFELYPFAEFSAQHWSSFAAVVESTTQTVPDKVKEYYKSKDLLDLGYILHILDNYPFALLPLDEVTPLYYASFTGLSGSVHMLLQAGVDAYYSCDGNYDNALQAASYAGHQKIVNMLLEAGADVNIVGELAGYSTALQAAVGEGHQEIAKTLLYAGADANAEGGGYGTALQIASSRGQDEIVELLLQAGANIEAGNGDYGNALYCASLEGYQTIVDILLRAGADVNCRGESVGFALYAAARRGYWEIVEILLQAGADVNAYDTTDGTAIQAASFRGYLEVVEILLQAGADVNAPSRIYGNALQAATDGKHQDIVERLLQAGANMNGYIG